MLQKFCVTILFACFCCTRSLPNECFNYYEEFSLHPLYNINQNPPGGTKVSDQTTLYKILEVSLNVFGDNMALDTTGKYDLKAYLLGS